MVKIRLQRQGAKKAPFYHIVVADSRSPRDGKIIEKIGTYNPMTEPSTIVLDKEKVEQWIKEGNRERVQVFEGIIIKKQGGGVNATFTVRKIAYGVGVEKTFMVHSPMIEKVEIVRVGKARRAKLYYLRDRVGKAAKTKENIGARIENKEITIKEEMVEEPISEETTTPVENATEEAPAVETENPVVEEVVDTVKEDKVDEVKE